MSTCFIVVFIWEVQIGDVCFQNAIIILKHVYCFCWCKNLCRRSFVPPPIHPQFSLGSGHSGYIVVYSAQYISSSKQNKKSGNKETLCSHTAWELKTNIPPHQIYINWYWNLLSTCDRNAQKDGFCWDQRVMDHRILSWDSGNITLGLCTHYFNSCHCDQIVTY